MRLADRIVSKNGTVEVWVKGRCIGTLETDNLTGGWIADRLMHDDDREDATVYVRHNPDGGVIWTWPEVDDG